MRRSEGMEGHKPQQFVHRTVQTYKTISSQTYGFMDLSTASRLTITAVLHRVVQTIQTYYIA